MPSFAAAALVFISSAAVLVLEILAGRLLAPYVGDTLQTYTGIIGVILAGISVGNWLGGKLADRIDPRRMLGPTLVLGGALSLVTVPVVDYLGAGLRGATPATIVTLSLCGFFAPAAVLSAVTPTVVKLQLDRLEETGRVVGRLSAIGTAGAIFGTFVSGFLLVALLPSRPIVRLVGASLIVLGLLVWVWLRSRREVTATALVGILAAGALSFAGTSPCEHESYYFCADVRADPQDSSGRVLWLDNLRHSYVDLEDPTHLEFSYARTLSDVLAHAAPPGEPLDVLHIGGGGFTMPRYLRHTRPGTDSTVLEIDPMLIDIATAQLGLELRDDIDVRIGDARQTLREIPRGSQDVVIGDAFGGVSVPWHLTTRQFVEQIEARLRPGGTYVLNLIDYGPRGFARAEAATLRAVFEHVAVLAPPARLRRPDGEGGNFILVGSDDPLPVEEILARNRARGDDEAAVSTGDGLGAFIGDAPVLTDDYAPVDQLITPLPPRP